MYSSSGLEALRKLLSSSSIAKFTLGGGSEFAEHQVKVTDLNHGSGRSRGALIVLAVPPGPTSPRIRALDDPAFVHGREACGAWGTGLHFESPTWPIFRQPSVECMIVIFVVAKDRLQARIVAGTDLREQSRSGGSIVDIGTRNPDGQQQAQRRCQLVYANTAKGRGIAVRLPTRPLCG